MSTFRRTMTGVLAAATIGAGIAASTTSADAQWRRGHHRGGWGGPVAAGVIGGLALGAIAAQAAPRYHYPAYGHGYAPAYAAPHYSCFRQRRPAYDHWGNFAGYRVVRVCH